MVAESGLFVECAENLIEAPSIEGDALRYFNTAIELIPGYKGYVPQALVHSADQGLAWVDIKDVIVILCWKINDDRENPKFIIERGHIPTFVTEPAEPCSVKITACPNDSSSIVPPTIAEDTFKICDFNKITINIPDEELRNKFVNPFPWRYFNLAIELIHGYEAGSPQILTHSAKCEPDQSYPSLTWQRLGCLSVMNCIDLDDQYGLHDLRAQIATIYNFEANISIGAFSQSIPERLFGDGSPPRSDPGEEGGGEDLPPFDIIIEDPKPFVPAPPIEYFLPTPTPTPTPEPPPTREPPDVPPIEGGPIDGYPPGGGGGGGGGGGAPGGGGGGGDYPPCPDGFIEYENKVCCPEGWEPVYINGDFPAYSYRCCPIGYDLCTNPCSPDYGLCVPFTDEWCQNAPTATPSPTPTYTITPSPTPRESPTPTPTQCIPCDIIFDAIQSEEDVYRYFNMPIEQIPNYNESKIQFLGHSVKGFRTQVFYSGETYFDDCGTEYYIEVPIVSSYPCGSSGVGLQWFEPTCVEVVTNIEVTEEALVAEKQKITVVNYYESFDRSCPISVTMCPTVTPSNTPTPTATPPVSPSPTLPPPNPTNSAQPPYIPPEGPICQCPIGYDQVFDCGCCPAGWSICTNTSCGAYGFCIPPDLFDVLCGDCEEPPPPPPPIIIDCPPACNSEEGDGRCEPPEIGGCEPFGDTGGGPVGDTDVYEEFNLNPLEIGMVLDWDITPSQEFWNGTIKIYFDDVLAGEVEYTNEREGKGYFCKPEGVTKITVETTYEDGVLYNWDIRCNGFCCPIEPIVRYQVFGCPENWDFMWRCDPTFGEPVIACCPPGWVISVEGDLNGFCIDPNRINIEDYPEACFD